MSLPKLNAPAVRVLYWFRTDLRLHDSPALTAALGLENIEAFYPMAVSSSVDGRRLGEPDQAQLKAEAARSERISRRSTPSSLEGMGNYAHGVRKARQRDENIINVAKREAPGMQIIVKDGHNLLDPELVVKKGNGGKCISTLVAWKKAAAKVGEIPRPLPAIRMLPDPGSLALQSVNNPISSLDGRNGNTKMDGPFARLKGENVNHDIMDKDRFDCFDSISGPGQDFALPTLSSLGLPEATTSILGGEAEALRRLEAFLSDKTRTATFSKPASAPTSLEPSTTQLSPYLKFGCLSVREFYWRAKDIIDSYKPKKGETVTKEPENLLGQLEFREMYYCAEFATPNYDRIRGNPLSKFMSWALMNHYDEKGEMIMPRPQGKAQDEERFLRWCYISWERGTEVFDEYLLDWDPASNPGNWMWLSCSAFFSQYFRVYGLVSWPLKTDKTGALVRKYCPELRDIPDKYIYAPHLAPLVAQQKAKCIIGQDYPFPMLDEKTEKERCIARLKIAFQVGLRGNATEVMTGKAEDILKQKFKHAMGREEDEDVLDGGGNKVTESPSGKRKAASSGHSASGPLDAFVKRQKQ
ncbi:hypothetical protein QFC21_001192 [Naganishia friedmannii]|uniref:Uncharacterized protein n=1 Tax=Naganishia friedmannii TaxID=89922 RepID=A0ACC2WAX4_9TREE|nr:hypothetical protein QFC21_001192 [Naganishia friedmannii]